MSEEDPRVWVGCLGCYNAGYLTGEWFDAVDAPTKMEEFNDALGFVPDTEAWELREDAYRPGDLTKKKMGRFSPEHGVPGYGHEELWVMDYENFHGFLDGECSPDHAKQIAEALADVDDWDLLDAFMSFTGAREYDTAREAMEAAREKFMASAHPTDDNPFVSDLDVAWTYLEDTCYFEGLPEHLENHAVAIARDWLASSENGGEIHIVHHERAVYMFSNY